MKKIVFTVVIILIALLIAYLWYLRTSIYWKLGDTPLFAPKDYTNYTIGEYGAAPIIYVALGDSLTAGVGVDSYTESYPYLIGKYISETQKTNVEIIPLAIPGIRSEYVAGYFLEPTVAKDPEVITLFIGTNDIHGNVGTKKFREHYENILETLTQQTDAKIYTINLPYIGTTGLIREPYRSYFNWQTQKYNSVINELSTKYNVTYIDLYNAHEPYKLDNRYYALDFFHPNALGYKLWAESVYANFSE